MIEHLLNYGAEKDAEEKARGANNTNRLLGKIWQIQATLEFKNYTANGN